MYVILFVILTLSTMGYSRDDLLSFRDTLPAVPVLSQSVISELRNLKINTVPQTSRGTRAGKHHQRPIKVISTYHRDQLPSLAVVNTNNLISLTPSQNEQEIQVQISNRLDIALDSSHVVRKQEVVHVTVQQSPKVERVKVSVGYLNARSVKNKSEEITDYVNDNELDICAITETWLSDGGHDELVQRELTPPGYRAIAGEGELP